MMLDTRSPLADLPLEVLTNVCEELDGAHRPSVASFALASKKCRLAAKAIQYRRIEFTSAEDSLQDVSRWTDILAAADGFSHVHEVHILFNLLEALQEEWAALLGLIERLRGLKDLVVDHEPGFIQELLPLLHLKGRCRLHLNHFRLQSLRGPAHDNAGTLGDFELSPDDRALALSPCLYSLKLKIGDTLREPTLDFNLQAVQQLVEGRNPRLKVVETYRFTRTKETPYSRQLMMHGHLPQSPARVVRAWHGLGPRDRSSGNLTCLHLGDPNTTLEEIKSWDACAAFASLRTLKLCLYPDLAILQWIAEQCNRRNLFLPLLTSFSLSILGTRDPHQAAQTLQQLLLSLPPLEELNISGCFDGFSDDQKQATFDLMLNRHGHVLKRMSPPTAQSSADVRKLVSICRRLEHLDVVVRRTGGDTDEVEVYRQLGRFSRLRNVVLTLDCTVDALEPRPYSRNSQAIMFDHQVLSANRPTRNLSIPRPANENNMSISNDCIYNAFVNCALDGPLAEAIFRQIAAERPAGALPLEVLNVKLLNAGRFRFGRTAELEPRAFSPIFDKYFGRLGWKVIPHPNDALKGEVIVENVIPVNEEYYASDCDAPKLGNSEPIFRSVWPVTTTGTWMNDWHSFPLTE
jgi:hypothetical protein